MQGRRTVWIIVVVVLLLMCCCAVTVAGLGLGLFSWSREAGFDFDVADFTGPGVEATATVREQTCQARILTYGVERRGKAPATGQVEAAIRQDEAKTKGTHILIFIHVGKRLRQCSWG